VGFSVNDIETEAAEFHEAGNLAIQVFLAAMSRKQTSRIGGRQPTSMCRAAGFEKVLT
jgi:hypothetical protein